MRVCAGVEAPQPSLMHKEIRSLTLSVCHSLQGRWIIVLYSSREKKTCWPRPTQQNIEAHSVAISMIDIVYIESKLMCVKVLVNLSYLKYLATMPPFTKKLSSVQCLKEEKITAKNSIIISRIAVVCTETVVDVE